MPTAVLGDVPIYFTDVGKSSGPPMVLVHGWGADSDEWIWHLDDLGKDYRVVTIDLRGHGHSGVGDPGSHTPDRMVQDLYELFEFLELDAAVLVGHSMGGQIVSLFAGEHPSRCSAVVTIDPGYGLSPEIVQSMVPLVESLGSSAEPGPIAVRIDSASFTPASPPAIRIWHERRLRAMPATVLFEALQAMFFGPDQVGERAASEEMVKRRKCPTLSFWIDPEQATWEKGLMTEIHSRTVIFEGAGHYLHEEQPQAFLAILRSWISKLPFAAVASNKAGMNA